MPDDSGTRHTAMHSRGSSAPADSDATAADAQPASAYHEQPGHVPSREADEREAAWRRGRRAGTSSTETSDVEASSIERQLTGVAFTALADSVRDYAIFLLDADGIIRHWGRGAHLMKRWTRAEAEGAHLRLMYMDGGSEDGTAEGHLEGAAEHGEYVSQGHRVRADGTVFWAQVTLTALRADDGTLIGFAKVTRDITARHVAEAARALAEKIEELAVSRGEHANLIAEIDVLKEELSVLQQELQLRNEQPIEAE
jgi:PAS domain S-box-containing protein